MLAIGVPAAALAIGLAPHDAAAAAAQSWPAFVLVAGLLLLGLVAGADGLFEAAGRLVARVGGSHGVVLLAASSVLIAVVSAVLNLDTAVTFLTPVVIVAARRRSMAVEPFCYLTVLLANAGSLLLPGSNLTNLIVLGTTHVSGSTFTLHMLPAWIAAVVSVPVVVALWWRRHLHAGAAAEGKDRARPRIGVGLVGVVLAVVAMLVLAPGPLAITVAAIGIAAALWRLREGRLSTSALATTLNAPMLVGLFGLATALGALGRTWSGPATLLAHCSSWETAGVGALTAVLVNNLPAASLLAAHRVADPYALLVGLNLGPNLAVTGALSAVLWMAAARQAGVEPSARRFSTIGVVVAPISMALALAALALA